MNLCLDHALKRVQTLIMHRYQILIEYVGTDFIGWQIQPKGPSIQKLIQIKMTKLLREKITIFGSGRTDAGVHAIEQSAHFDCKNEIRDPGKFLKSINYFLNNKNISMLDIKKRIYISKILPNLWKFRN